MNDTLRQQFPALQRRHNGRPLIYLDGPAGTQAPQSVIDAMVRYYQTSNANTHGPFLSSAETDAVMESVRHSMAAYLNAEGPHTISLGQNMTTLNFSLARAVGRVLQPGDEILITQLDHEANRGPWLSLRDQGIIVREIRLDPDGRLDYDDMERKLNERTRLVAMGYASNILGTVNDVRLARRLTHQVGAWLLLDAVHYAAHFAVDVQDVGCDFLLCSAYKFYGPHVGILYSRPGLLDRLQPDRLRTTDQHAPYCIETGTLNHAAMAGVDAAVRFIASLGEGDSLRRRIVSAMDRIHVHEMELVKKLYKGLEAMDGVEVLGPTARDPVRAPTLAITVENRHPEEIGRLLADQNIFGWVGHFYAVRAVEVLGLLEKGGVTRLGISAYTLEEEVDQTLEVFQEIVAG